jgi:hypothetical protein
MPSSGRKRRLPVAVLAPLAPLEAAVVAAVVVDVVEEAVRWRIRASTPSR